MESAPSAEAVDSPSLGWHIGEVRPGGTPNDLVINAALPIADEDASSIRSAVGLLAGATQGHPLNDLRREAGRVAELVDSWGESTPSPAEGPELQQRMLDWLTRFRAFDDHSKRRLSRTYGKTSSELAAFNEACSHEYDTVFAYRFAYKLRNYVQHVGQAVQHISGSHDAVTGERHLEISFDPVVLLDEYDAWGSRLTRELRSMDGRFPVLLVIIEVMQCCDRIIAKELLAQEVPLRQASKILRHALDRAPKSEDGEPYLPRLAGDPQAEVPPTNMEVMPLPRGLPPLIERALSEAARLQQVR